MMYISNFMKKATREGLRTADTARWLSSKGPGESPLKQLLDEASAFGEAGEGEAELRWATSPYAQRRKEPPRPLADPRDAAVLLFPGQGSHFVGMGRKLEHVPAAKELYEFASSVVGWDVWRTCVEGGAAALEQRAPTCVVVTSLGAVELARETRAGALERVACAAGFSLGELSALAWAGALPLERALRLVELRTAAMQAAARARAGGMLTVWLAPDARLQPMLHAAKEHAATTGLQDPVALVANYLYPNCKVIAGDEEALGWIERSGRAWGVRRAARVRVAGAFHTPLMEAAGAALREALAHVDVAAPRVPVYCGAEARVYGGATDVRRGVWRALARPVRWEQTLHAMYARGRDTPQPLTLALGPGPALRATLKQVNARAWDASLQIDV